MFDINTRFRVDSPHTHTTHGRFVTVPGLTSSVDINTALWVTLSFYFCDLLMKRKRLV